MRLLIPTYSEAYGVPKTNYPSIENGEEIFGSFRTFGGTDREVNGQLAVEKTATIETWYRPDIKSDCRIALPETGEIYKIIGAPEDIEMRHQYLRIRVIAIEGGAGQ